MNTKNYKRVHFTLDRSGQVINIEADLNNAHNVLDNFKELTPEQWLRRTNELFRGQPFVLVKDKVVDYINCCLT